ncbi:sensor domain-containing diguanylate cyclase [Noviherbaspirillum aridicola]|uniref:PAS domain S-box-containing protein/diguanylate cyclase (GGDEF)-like protein n=1 Tax=Noviherbaspirillum aridicola TaxID=2849687 RepID=A0ABQ4Q8C5_9BURK|nr:diguanylate cyclase [Noviherbaspirillum aridicola]GIZ53327.1 hypothetical protein NCCP691_33410 [Noviherbaspirillum aridicola]
MRTLSLRIVILIFVSILIAPALILASVIADDAAADLEAAERSAALHIARGITALNAEVVRTTRGVLAAFSHMPAMTGADWDSCNRTLAAAMRDQAYKAYTGFGVFSLNGDLVCDSEPVSGINVADRAWFKATRRADDFANGGYVIGRSSGLPILPFGHPVRDASGKTVAILLGAIKLDWLEESIKTTQEYSNAIIRVLDAEGRVLAHAPSDSKRVGAVMALPDEVRSPEAAGEGFVSLVDLDGERRLFAYARMTETGGTVLTAVGTGSASAGAVAPTALLWLILVFVAAFAGTWWGFSFLSRPIHQLLNATRLVGQGEAVSFGQITHVKEFQEVAVAFDSMSSLIASREQALRDSRNEVRLLLESVGEGVFGVDPEGRISFANPEALRLTGYSTAELVGKDMHETIHHASEDGREQPRQACAILACLGSGRSARVTSDVFWRRDGSSFRVEYSINLVESEGKVRGAVIVFRDVTDLRQAEERRRQSEARFRVIFNSAGDPMFVHRLDGRLVEANSAAQALLGFTAASSFGGDALNDRGMFRAQYHDRLNVLKSAGTIAFEASCTSATGAAIVLEITAHLTDYDGALAVISVARDVTDRKLAESQIRRLALFDNLTGLPNRALTTERLVSAISLCCRSDKPVCVFFMDLDRFKAVNDSLGHDAGDELLRQVASRLTGCLRAGDTVGRLGGDEFVAVLPEMLNLHAAEALARKILVTIGRPFSLEKGEVSVGISIGIAFYPGNGGSAETLLKEADKALYQAKRSGRNTWAVSTAVELS